MSDKSAIEWTDATWNPIRSTGGHYCERISPGCDHCYAATMTRRFAGHDYPRVSDAGEPGGKVAGVAPILAGKALAEPLRWAKPRRVFVCSMTDLFGEWVPEEWLDRIFAVMALTGRHTFQVLTKRPKRMREYAANPETPRRIGEYMTARTILELPGQIDAARAAMAGWHRAALPWPLPNVWLGVSVELDRLAWRATVLAETPAAVRFVSAEPLLGPLPSLALVCPICRGSGLIDAWVGGVTKNLCPCLNSPGGQRPLDWLIVGAESGHGARPMDDDWVRDLRDRATAAGVRFFFKQRLERGRKVGLPALDGKVWSEIPAHAPPRALVGEGV